MFSNVYYNSVFLQRIFRRSFLSSILHKIYQYYEFFAYRRSARKQARDANRRRCGYEDSRFMPMRELKGRYVGKRCFITCTGPSLTISDLEKLESEYVFGMNSICMIHDKTKWKPDFFGIQDLNVYDKVKDCLLNTDNGMVFAPYDFRTLRNTPDKWVYFHISGSYHLYDRKYKNKFWTFFSDDCYVTVYDGFSITYSLIQIAIYMGFDEIYLIGADCNYLGNSQHFIEHGNFTSAKDADTAGDRNIVSYLKAKEYADSHNIKIINTTRGGMLEVFPRKSIEDVLAHNEKNKISD